MLNNKQLHVNKVLQLSNEDLLKYIEWLTANRDKDDKLYVKSLSTITVLERNNQEYADELEVTHQICTDLEKASDAVIEQNAQLRCELKHAEDIITEMEMTIKARDRALRMARGELEALRKRSYGTFGGKC